jgi:lipopolysaccharide/colanic/teichoic acid biosynthesis glycosyltransferase
MNRKADSSAGPDLADVTTSRSDRYLPSTRYAHLTEDGTGFILAGSAVAGLGAYIYQFLGGRVLGAEAFAPVSVLLTIHFMVFVVVLLPIEQLVIRRLTLNWRTGGVPPRAVYLAGVVAGGATLFAFFGVDRYLNGDMRFVAFVALTIVTHTGFAIARGHLAGNRRFREYGLASAGASLVRLAVAVAVLAVRPSASGFAIALIVGPIAVAAWRPFRQSDPDDGRPEISEAELEGMTERGLLSGLVLASAASQALLLAGPIVAGLLGAPAVQLSIVFATFTLGRAPLTFGYNLLARVLPPFTEMAARGERRELRAWARGMALAAIALGALATLIGFGAGPWIVRIAFGPDFAPDRMTAALVAGGVVLAGAGLFVGQILVARGRTLRLAMAWIAAVATATLAVLATPELEPVLRVAVGFIVGEAAALAALVTAALVTERAAQEPEWVAYAIAKRSIDIAGATMLLLFTLPLVVMAGGVVKLTSRGPAFFRQIRTGRGGVPFAMLKLRTMHADADQTVFAAHVAALESSRHEGAVKTIRIEDDPRVTRVGAVLRKASLDELPNLWNVLKGSMSLVGPRPLVPDEAKLIGFDDVRFSVKPGITGLAQVNGRDELSLEERTALDQEYVQNRSVAMDLRILVRTAVAVIRQPGD